LSETESEEEFIEGLKRSRETLGELQAVIVDQNGNVIDGRHRMKAYPGWKTEVVQVDRKKSLLLRIHYNYNRSKGKEIKQLLLELAYILEKEGIPKHEIAKEIVKIVPFSETHVYTLLPKKFKEPKKAKPKETFRKLYPQEQARVVTGKAREETKQKVYACPVCGTILKLVGDLLVQV
jgi:hypothetical protein